MTFRSHLAFSLALHRAVAPDPLRSTCWSPYSVASALGLAALGAADRTRDELVTALLGDVTADLQEYIELLTAAAELGASYGDEAPVLAVSNTLWANEKSSIRPEFAKELAGWPGGRVRPAPFSTAPEDSRQLINADVAETTRGLIPELIPAGAIEPDTVAALVNALYLRTAWSHSFSDTVELPFHSPTGTRTVPTMRQTERLGYATEAGWQVIVLPAAGEVDAVVLLPDHDLATAEPQLDAATLERLLDAPQRTRLALSLPRLRLSTNAELDGPLRQLGIETLFTKDADLSRLSPDPMCVSAVLHEAVLRLDEQGMEGAAATAMVFRTTAFVQEEDPVVVQVDRPFLLLVRHRRTGALYFLSRVTEP